MIIVLVLLFVSVTENHFFVGLIDIWFKYLVWTVGMSDPIIGFVFKIIETNFWISIRHTYVVALIFENSGYFTQHFL